MWYWGRKALLFRLAKAAAFLLAIVLMWAAYGYLAPLIAAIASVLIGQALFLYFYNKEVAICRGYILDGIRDGLFSAEQDTRNESPEEQFRRADAMARREVMSVVRERPYERT
jgi:hypothetical protein